jgi:predicted ArsR family transcriptional regulator
MSTQMTVLVAMLSAPNGASVAEIQQRLKWTARNVQRRISDLQDEYTVERRYHLIAEDAARGAKNGR